MPQVELLALFFKLDKKKISLHDRYILFFFIFEDSVSLWNPDWPWAWGEEASCHSLFMLRLKALHHICPNNCILRKPIYILNSAKYTLYFIFKINSAISLLWIGYFTTWTFENGAWQFFMEIWKLCFGTIFQSGTVCPYLLNASTAPSHPASDEIYLFGNFIQCFKIYFSVK